MKPHILLLVVLLPLVWQSARAAGEGHACDLLTKQEVEEILGEKIDAVEVQPGYGNCIFYKLEAFLGQTLKLPVVTVGYTRSDVQARWDYWSSTPRREAIADVGDGAIWSPDYGFFVCRVKGGLLMISARGKEVAVKLAKRAIGRIKP